jgi:hypothetical protein
MNTRTSAQRQHPQSRAQTFATGSVMKRKAIRWTVFFFGFLEETARVPERWFGRTPPNKENPAPSPTPSRGNTRETVLYVLYMEEIKAKKRSERTKPL